jgi:hypothetical protein
MLEVRPVERTHCQPQAMWQVLLHISGINFELGGEDNFIGWKVINEQRPGCNMWPRDCWLQHFRWSLLEAGAAALLLLRDNLPRGALHQGVDLHAIV